MTDHPDHLLISGAKPKTKVNNNTFTYNGSYAVGNGPHVREHAGTTMTGQELKFERRT
jgi:hypothetical protein